MHTKIYRLSTLCGLFSQYPLLHPHIPREREKENDGEITEYLLMCCGVVIVEQELSDCPPLFIIVLRATKATSTHFLCVF